VTHPDEWYQGPGALSTLRFECTQCGACCTGPEGAVHFSEAEAKAIAAHLGITVEAFSEQYTHRLPEGRSLRERESPAGSGRFDCIFLDRTTHPGRAFCSIYTARPTQCRTFPWWPANLKDPTAWQRAASLCEGIGRGGFVAIDEVRISRNRQAAAHSIHR
jgi:Fe-S-cluster containining protein